MKYPKQISLLLSFLTLLPLTISDQGHDHYVRRNTKEQEEHVSSGPHEHQQDLEGQHDQRDLTSSSTCPTAEYEVFVVGAGWAGIGALHQLNRFKRYYEKKYQASEFRFMAADMAPVVGGRANIARVVSGRKNNPLMDMVRKYFYRGTKEQKGKMPLDYSTVDWEDAMGYTKDGQRVKKQNKKRKKHYEVFDCVTDLDGKIKPPEFTANNTVEDVLKHCGSRATPSQNGYKGNFLNAHTHWDFELETLMPTNKASAFNVPFSAYIDFSDHDVFIPNDGSPSEGTVANGATIAEAFIKDELDTEDLSEYVMFETQVTKIKYDNDDGCVYVATVSTKDPTGSTQTFHVQKVIFTGSAGVLNAYGDDNYSTPSVFQPFIPQMNTLRKLFFVKKNDDTYRREMSDYKELTVQVSEDVLEPKKVRKAVDYNFLFFETRRKKRGHGLVWQNMDRDCGEFYPGSRAFVAEISPSVLFEDDTITESLTSGNGDEWYPYDEAKIEWMVDNTLGKVLRLENFAKCKRVGPGPIKFDADALTIDNLPDEPEYENVDCIYHMFDGPNPPYGLWEGSWSVLIRGDWDLQDDYIETVKKPLPYKGVNKVYLAGEHMCYKYLGYQQGAYLSGLEEGLRLIEDGWSSDSGGYKNTKHYTGYNKKDLPPEQDERFRCDGGSDITV